MIETSTSPNTTRPRWTWIVLASLCVSLGWATLQFEIWETAGVTTLLALLALTLVWPEKGILILTFILYTNLAVIVTKFNDVAPAQAALVGFLFIVPLVISLTLRRQKLIVDPVFLAMWVYLGAMLAASFFAKDVNMALEHVAAYFVEGLALYALILNVVRQRVVLEQVLWTLLLAGCLLGGLSLYQELTHQYDHQFGGLAQRYVELDGNEVDAGGKTIFRNRPEINISHRAAGSIGEANRYAQMMLVLFPLALFQYRQANSRWLRIYAALAVALILCGVFLSYSRGAFLILGLLLVIMLFLRVLRPYQILTAALGMILLIALVAPGYFGRMETIRGVSGLFSKTAAVRPDQVTRGRVTEMLAALHVFLDHPVLGVGPGQYAPHYSADYQRDPNIALRYIAGSRRAHTLYFEIAAETGIIGFIIFMVVVGILLFQLWRVRRSLLRRRPDLSDLATAFWLSVIAYLGTAVFLHLSYQRYYWFLLALAGATLQIIREEAQTDFSNSKGKDDAHEKQRFDWYEQRGTEH